MKTIRIASGAGYAGDRIEPALDCIQRGRIDYIIFECLAERTIALAQEEKLRDPNRGYNPLLDYRMQQVIPLLKHHAVKVITNMGAANPLAAGKTIYDIACQHGLSHLKIAVIQGDNILEKIEKYYDQPIMETGEPLSNIAQHIISANVYLGAEQISHAIADGADIVVTGRVADPALVTAPLMVEFNKDYGDFEFLGQTIVAGHLLECAAQVTGGYFADPGYKDVPDLWNVAFPIVSFSDNGDMILEKLPDTGGLVNTMTVKEQLLYEIHDPANYYTPDVVADFSRVTVQEISKDRVKIANGTGKAKTGYLKTSVGYANGYLGEGEISYGGHNCVARAKLSADIIRKRLDIINLDYQELRIDLIGVNSLYGASANQLTPIDVPEIRLRVTARTSDYASADMIGREVEALYVNGPAGGGGARKTAHRNVAIASILIPEADIVPTTTWYGGTS